MLLAYQFKIDPKKSQVLEMDRCLHLLRLQYNWRLRERIEAYEQVSQPKLGEYTDLHTGAVIYPLTCSVSKSALSGEPWKVDKKTGLGKRKSAYEQQSSDLPNLKKERPWYAHLPSQPLQQMLRQLDDAFQRFYSGQNGYPKYKRRGKFRSFTYPSGACEFNGNKVRLPGFGWIKFYQSRPFPNEFTPKKVTVRKKAVCVSEAVRSTACAFAIACRRHQRVGWYIRVTLEDATVPITPQPNVVKTAVGVDVGIKKLASLSNGEIIENKKFSARQEKKRNRLNRAATRKKLGSRNRYKAYQRLARLDQKIANQRQDYQWNAAHKLVDNFDFIVFVSVSVAKPLALAVRSTDLNIQGMMKRCKPRWDEAQQRYVENGQSRKAGLNKAIQDASWYSLKQKTKAEGCEERSNLAERYGCMVHEINPKHTSQECSTCGYVSPTNRDKERFICESCLYFCDADINAAKNILNRGLDELGIKLEVPEDIREFTPTESVTERSTSAQWVEPGNESNTKRDVVGVQLSLFDLMDYSSESPSKSLI